MKRYSHGSHPYYQYNPRRSLSLNVKRKHRPWLFIVIPFIGFLLIGDFYLYNRPLPLLSPEKRVLELTTKQPNLEWPTSSQAAFGTLEQGLLESENDQAVRPTASVTKLLTVLTILQAKPLKLGEQGPMIPITQADVDIYNKYYSKDGSLVPVVVGEQISEYQMLEGILLPSSNNYADSLAIWAFGNLDKYRISAQAMAEKIGMKKTTVGEDASGFSPTTTSTAADLTLLGIAAIKHPVIAKIVKQTEINLPVAGLKHNTNWLLGDEGVVGIKTGNTNEAGGVFVFAYNHLLDAKHKVTIIGAIQGEPTIFNAVLEARSFIKRIKTHFAIATPIKKDQILATYSTPWGQKVAAVAKQDLSFVLWPGKPTKMELTLDNIAPNLPPNSQVGQVSVGDVSSQIVTNGRLADPSWQWRFFGKR